PAVVQRVCPGYEVLYAERGWKMFPSIERVYVNERARRELGWSPRYDFAHAVESLSEGTDPRSALAREIGAKGYHAESTGIYTVR
ncbi:MAG: NAD(P)-dependent oxidoreductase, partial [Actinomycetota bacterium]|nr:NAD(P)-dependent oxidoreductase [Actinomycetota bacterium]